MLDILKAVHIRDPDRVFNAYVHELSGGMGQRVMTAMMVVANPMLLIADEPTSALDVTVRMQVLAIIDDLVTQRGMGLMFISHDLNLVGSFCDRDPDHVWRPDRRELQAADLHKVSHPYSRGLLESLPSIEKPKEVLATLKRDPAWLADPDGPRSAQPACRLRSWPQQGPCRARHLLLRCQGRMLRHRRQIRIGQDHGPALALWPQQPLAGRDPDRWPPAPRHPDRAFCRTVQIVFQDPYGSLHPRQTVDRCLREPLEIQGIGQRDQRIADTLNAVGLNQSFRYRYPHQLSGGQRQRVGIARALMLEPKLLFLDEPTSALDVSVQAEILNLLVRLRKERGFTYVLVTHDLSIISHMCERLIVMNVGRIVEAMPVTALRERTPENPYTQQLLQASLGYDRKAVERYQTFD